MKEQESRNRLETQIEGLEYRCEEIDLRIEGLQSEKSELITQLEQLKQQNAQELTSQEVGIREEAEPVKIGGSSLQFPLPLCELSPEKLVTKESSLKEKYELFCSLFEGRPDIHGKRFQSKSSGIVGYSPVCANEFKHMCSKANKEKRVKCVDCDFQAFGPIEIEEFTKHAKGESATCDDVLASYAIDQDAMSSFIAADFDAKGNEGNAEAIEALHESVITFMKVSEKFGVPTYLERSRSGRGFHVWLFFEAPVSAKDARRLFSALLTVAMEENAQINFSSYDRFFPHQDTLSDSRIGNLIALPLQGQAVRQGNSVFVDKDFMRYPDQWAFLSQIKRFSPEDLKRTLAGMLITGDVGEFGGDSLEDSPAKPWEKKRPELPLTSKDFTDDLKIIKANMFHLEKEQLSTRAYNRLRRLASFRNPEFYEAQMMHRDTGLIPSVISTYDEVDGFLCLPRGIEDSLYQVLREGNIAYEVIDRTQKGKPLHATFKGELRDDQSKAINTLHSYDTGVLELPTGSGKTVVGIKAIAEISVNTLVLVNNKNLLAQWKEKLNEFLDIADEPPLYYTPTGRKRVCPVVGEYSGSKKQLSGLVDVAMVQSLFRDGAVNDLVKDYGLVIIDECHHIPSFSFTSVLKAINAKFLYGLTATPERKDGHEMILYMQCGPTRYRIDPLEQARKRSFEQIVIPRFTHSLPDDPNEKFNMAKLYGELANDHKRNDLVVSDILACIKEKRNPLVLTERTEHVEELTALLKNHFENVLSVTGKMSDPEKRVFHDRIKNLGLRQNVWVDLRILSSLLHSSGQPDR